MWGHRNLLQLDTTPPLSSSWFNSCPEEEYEVLCGTVYSECAFTSSQSSTQGHSHEWVDQLRTHELGYRLPLHDVSVHQQKENSAILLYIVILGPHTFRSADNTWLNYVALPGLSRQCAHAICHPKWAHFACLEFEIYASMAFLATNFYSLPAPCLSFVGLPLGEIVKYFET